ncbi:MAG TPA: hypothetical protein VK034_17565 [Enhygromyxa sp.]|nr:hypothetical protein [Enhygromyxa sp.]
MDIQTAAAYSEFTGLSLALVGLAAGAVAGYHNTFVRQSIRTRLEDIKTQLDRIEAKIDGPPDGPDDPNDGPNDGPEGQPETAVDDPGALASDESTGDGDQTIELQELGDDSSGEGLAPTDTDTDTTEIDTTDVG